jgi:hypothetical protein
MRIIRTYSSFSALTCVPCLPTADLTEVSSGLESTLSVATILFIGLSLTTHSRTCPCRGNRYIFAVGEALVRQKPLLVVRRSVVSCILHYNGYANERMSIGRVGDMDEVFLAPPSLSCRGRPKYRQINAAVELWNTRGPLYAGECTLVCRSSWQDSMRAFHRRYSRASRDGIWGREDGRGGGGSSKEKKKLYGWLAITKCFEFLRLGTRL